MKMAFLFLFKFEDLIQSKVEGFIMIEGMTEVDLRKRFDLSLITIDCHFSIKFLFEVQTNLCSVLDCYLW